MLGSSAGSGSMTEIGSITGIGSAGIELGSISTLFSSKYFTSPVVQFDSILAIIDYPSYMMLIEPASKVSLPLVVVMRTRSSNPDNVTDPPPNFTDPPAGSPAE